MLLEKLIKDFNRVALEKNEIALSTLRLLRAALKNKEIELRPKKQKLTEEIILEVIKKEVKKRDESILAYRQAKRQDLVQKEEKEKEILKKYLPEGLSDDKIKEIIQKKIKEIGASSIADFGKVMGGVMKKVKGKADGSKVSQLVKESLSLISNV